MTTAFVLQKNALRAGQQLFAINGYDEIHNCVLAKKAAEHSNVLSLLLARKAEVSSVKCQVSC
jgi:hypothetical protein